jgi:hypothetical protein
MKPAKTILCIFLTALYLFFPGSGLAFVNHILHDRGLPEIECTCDSQTQQHANYPLSDHGDHSSISDTDCPCANHIPINRSALEHDVFPVCVSFFEKTHFVPEVYYPIIVPPHILTV